MILAARLCAIDPGLGGLVLSDDVPLEAILAVLGEVTVRRLPGHVDDEALCGGLDLGATLASGRPVHRKGLLETLDGGIIVTGRMGEATAGRIAQALDEPRGFFIVATEPVPAVLAERLAFHPAALTEVPSAPIGDDEARQAIAETAEALGVSSARAMLLAMRAARASAALEARVLDQGDIARAAQLVLAPRATRLPAEPPPPPPPPSSEDSAPSAEPQMPDDLVVAAAKAAIPKDVLDRIAAGAGRVRAASGHGAGERRRAPTRGRPVGVRAGVPRGGLRLALVDTLRAAAPWQRLRGRDGPRLRIRQDDLRVKRFEARAQATTIFAVDASGSSAAARLAEAKGAVELLLGQAYVKRAQVALVAFRGAGADLLLPPTRSLARARRLLGDLPGGGGTPLAAGLDAAHDLALALRAKGQTPFIVILTDGRANVARDGGRDRAQADAESAARAIGQAGIAGAFVDIAPRPRPEGERLAAAMVARYLPLPRADARTVHAAIATVQP